MSTPRNHCEWTECVFDAVNGNPVDILHYKKVRYEHLQVPLKLRNSQAQLLH